MEGEENEWLQMTFRGTSKNSGEKEQDAKADICFWSRNSSLRAQYEVSSYC